MFYKENENESKVFVVDFGRRECVAKFELNQENETFKCSFYDEFCTNEADHLIEDVSEILTDNYKEVA